MRQRCILGTDRAVFEEARNGQPGLYSLRGRRAQCPAIVWTLTRSCATRKRGAPKEAGLPSNFFGPFNVGTLVDLSCNGCPVPVGG
jgi:hypothetical protein